MPDTAQVSIVNRVLALLGQEPVADLGEGSLDGSLAAVKVMRQIEEARDTVLRRHGWTCALTYDTLNAAILPGATSWRYPTVYLLPGDGLRVWEIEGIREIDGWGPRWQAGSVETPGGGARLVIRSADTTQPQLNIAYVRRAGWLALDAHVADAIAWDLAARTCYSVTGDSQRQMKLDQKAETKVLEAISVDSTQEGNQPPLAPSIPQAIRNYSR